MEYAYKKYTNLDRDASLDGYKPGHRLCLTWIGTLPVAPAYPMTPSEIAEFLFTAHNRDDRPDGALCPSMSIGDVVTVRKVRGDDGGLLRGEEWTFACADVGFTMIDTPNPSDVTTDWWTVAFDRIRRQPA